MKLHMIDNQEVKKSIEYNWVYGINYYVLDSSTLSIFLTLGLSDVIRKIRDVRI